jgi:hypothetical protein
LLNVGSKGRNVGIAPETLALDEGGMVSFTIEGKPLVFIRKEAGRGEQRTDKMLLPALQVQVM